MRVKEMLFLLLFVFHVHAESTFLKLCLTSKHPEIITTIRAIHDAVLEITSKDLDKQELACNLIDERLTKITALDLSDKNISNLYPLSDLNNLTILNLSHNNITNIWPLAGLSNLTNLNLNNNKISDISVLANFTNLRRLYLGNNNITAILPIQDLYYLSTLSINNNPVSKQTDLVENLHIMIYKRSIVPEFIKRYAPLNIKNKQEIIETLNYRAKNGDLEFFRSVRNNEEKVRVTDDREIWNYLYISTRKIIIGVSIAEELANYLKDKIIENTGIDFDIEEADFNQTKKVIEYFIMEDAPRIPFSFADKDILINILTQYAKKINYYSKTSHNIKALSKTFFSPQFVAQELNNWAEKNKHNQVFHGKTGF
jgi:Leucine-rich repeat (LRR) protein